MAVILICEDDTSLASYWRQLLEAERHTVWCSENVPQALRLAEEKQPDLVITDMMIKQNGKFVPEGGLSLLFKLIFRSRLSMPILGVSGYRPGRYNEIPALEFAKSMGIDQALYKPISPERLLATVHHLLSVKKNTYRTSITFGEGKMKPHLSGAL